MSLGGVLSIGGADGLLITVGPGEGCGLEALTARLGLLGVEFCISAHRRGRDVGGRGGSTKFSGKRSCGKFQSLDELVVPGWSAV